MNVFESVDGLDKIEDLKIALIYRMIIEPRLWESSS